MDLALQRDRPAVFEVLSILVLCAVLLVGLAKMDNSAARREAQRAHAVLAAKAAAEAAAKARNEGEEVAQEATRTTTVPVTARTESLGSRGPIAIPVGAAWSPGTSASVAHAKPPSEPKPPDVPSVEFRRIVGPTAASEPPMAVPTATPEAKRVTTVVVPKTGAPPTMRRAAPSDDRPGTVTDALPAHERRNILLVLLAGCGLLMCAGGATILSRAR